MKIAINGAGIAGPTLAYWLHRFGHEPTLIERAPQLRSGGYVIDFWGVGYDIAEKMGLLPEIREQGYLVQDIRFVDTYGRTSASFDPELLRSLARGRFASIERSALAACIYGLIEARVETLFGDSIAGMALFDDGVQVVFENAAPRRFDLVVGADGLHSRVRDLAFGPRERFEYDLGIRAAAVELDGYRPRDVLAFVSHSVPGRQVSRFAKRDDKTMVFFAFRDQFARKELPRTDAQRRDALCAAMAGVGWECPHMLEALENAGEIYFDKVSQIRMDRWTRGRIALIGDAACAVSLLAGEGTGLAMAEAYVLAGELARAEGDHKAAFERFESRMMPFVRGKQQSALAAAASFVPKSWPGVVVRDLAMRLLPGPLVARLGFGELIDDIELPVYEGDAATHPPA